VEALETWYLGLPHFAQLAIWALAMLLAARCCSRKTRPVYQSGR